MMFIDKFPWSLNFDIYIFIRKRGIIRSMVSEGIPNDV